MEFEKEVMLHVKVLWQNKIQVDGGRLEQLTFLVQINLEWPTQSLCQKFKNLLADNNYVF